MITSTDLQKLTNDFVSSGGKIEKHDIIIRDFASTKTGFMITSTVKEKPKVELKARKKRDHSFKQRNKALTVMEKHENLSVKEIVELSGVSENTVRDAVKHSGYKVRMLARAKPPVGKNHIIEVANENLTATEIADKTGCSKTLVYSVCKTAGIKIKSERNQMTELARAILSIKTSAYTAKQIAEKFECSEPYVRTVCKKHNRKIKKSKNW